MRVIAGKARRLQLKTVPGMETRPTTDRIKETLFNMLSTELYDCRFLDLFAGSGAIGIEAVSRGAKEAVFVENNPKAAACIRENLAHTKLSEQAQLMVTDVLTAIRRLEGTEKFDIIFMDPPYQKKLERAVLEQLAASGILAEDGIVIIEAALETDFSYLEETGWHLVRRKEYKTNAHLFVQQEGTSHG